MRIGDKVRLLRGTEEGYIKSIKGNIIEVEIEDGFIIPAPKNEIVIVHHRESEVFGKEVSAPTPKPEHQQNELPNGLLLGIRETSDNRHSLVFINQTDDAVLFSIYQQDKKSFHLMSSGKCEARELASSGNVLLNPDSGHYKIVLQIIPCPRQPKLIPLAISIDLDLHLEQFRLSTFLQKLQTNVHLIRIEQPSVQPFDTAKLQSRMMEGIASPKQKDTLPRASEQIVDLHIDSLTINLPENQILSYQLDLFEKAYDRALVSNVEKLKIIHGIGSGKLRNEIHKRLSIRKEVRFFEDADKDRFGYGATVIYL